MENSGQPIFTARLVDEVATSPSVLSLAGSSQLRLRRASVARSAPTETSSGSEVVASGVEKNEIAETLLSLADKMDGKKVEVDPKHESW